MTKGGSKCILLGDMRQLFYNDAGRPSLPYFDRPDLKPETPLKAPLHAAALIFSALLGSSPDVAGAEKPRVKILAALAVEPAFPELEPLISAATGATLDIEFAMAATIVDRLNMGEAADVVILTKDGAARMALSGRVGPGADLVSTDIGLAVADTAPLPVIDSAADLAAFLKATPSIAYSARGASGVHFAKLIAQLGLTDVVKPKAVVIEEGLTATRLLKGEVAAAVQQTAELRFGGAKQIVTLPDTLQVFTVYTAAPVLGSRQGAEQAAAIGALTSKPAAEAFTRSGVRPVFEGK